MDLSNHKIFQKLSELGLEKDEYVIFGSGVMFALGIRQLEDLDDIDLVVSSKGWEKVKNMAEIEVAKDWGCEFIQLDNGEIEIYSDWGPGKYDITKLIESSLQVSGFNFANTTDTIRWKKEMGREKDLKHIQMIQDFLAKSKK